MHAVRALHEGRGGDVGTAQRGRGTACDCGLGRGAWSWAPRRESGRPEAECVATSEEAAAGVGVGVRAFACALCLRDVQHFLLAGGAVSLWLGRAVLPSVSCGATSASIFVLVAQLITLLILQCAVVAHDALNGCGGTSQTGAACRLSLRDCF